MMLSRRRDPVQEAVAIATLTASFNAHQIECTKDKLELKQALALQNVERQRMHEENERRFTQILRYVWIATGAFGTLQVLAVMAGNGIGRALLKALLQ